MKNSLYLVFTFVVGLVGCQRTNQESAGLDSLAIDSARLADSLAAIVSVASRSSPFQPPVLTFRPTVLSADSTATRPAGTVEALVPVEILGKTNAYVGDDCGYFVYHVRLPDSRTGWMIAPDLAFPSDSFMKPTTVNLSGKDYTVFALSRGGEVTGQECGGASILLIYSHSEKMIHIVNASDEVSDSLQNFNMQIGQSIEFFTTMVYPSILSVASNNGRIELELKLTGGDMTFSTFRLFVENIDNRFYCNKYVAEAKPAY